MAIKIYISGICGSHEVRKQQQRVLFILQGMPFDLQIVDITEPGKEDELTFMQETAKKHNKKTQIPPQIFNDDQYCGDYADFELANDDDEIMKFLKLESGPSKTEIMQSEEHTDSKQNGIHENEDVLDLNRVNENGKSIEQNGSVEEIEVKQETEQEKAAEEASEEESE